jgi:hypothetical protein
MWLVIRNIIQMVDFGKKNWRVVNFASCVIVESVDHLFFNALLRCSYGQWLGML